MKRSHKRGLRSKPCRVSLFPILLVVFSCSYIWLSLSLGSIDTISPPAVLRHDPYYVKTHRLPFHEEYPGVCDAPPGTGEEGPAGIQGLYKIKTGEKGPVPRIKVFCMVYTHSNRHDILQSIVETYGQNCDGFLAASNLTDPSLGAFALTHDGPEAYDNMWNKVRAMWEFIHQNFLLDFDWFHIGGDDMYLIPDNLRRLASKYSQKRPYILGASIPNSKNPTRRYCGGGAGYTLNRKAVNTVVNRFSNGNCPAANAPDEDIRLSRCLEDIGVKCSDTNDEDEDVRYHHLDAQFHAGWVPTRHALWLWEKLQYFHNIRGNQTKLAQISNTSVSFHLAKTMVRSKSRDRGIRRYHAILNDLCGTSFSAKVADAAMCTKEQRDKLNEKWKEVPKG